MEAGTAEYANLSIPHNGHKNQSSHTSLHGSHMEAGTARMGHQGLEPGTDRL